jgi:acyl-coenzyme A synthetase/AMP-(fatty) acid ligase
MANRLRQQGVVPGSRVAIVADDAAEFALSFFAAASCGAVVVLGAAAAQVSTSSPEHLPQFDADYLLVSVVSRSSGAARAHRTRRIILSYDRPSRVVQKRGGRLTQMGPVLAEPPRKQSASVMRSQANLAHEARCLVDAIGLKCGDQVLSTLALADSAAVSLGLLAPIRARAMLACCESRDASTVVRALLASRPTVLVTDCETLLALAGRGAEVERRLAGVRRIVAPRAESLPQLLEAGGSVRAKLVTVYYRPETGVIALNAHGGPPDCAGRPLPGVRVWVERAWHADPASLAGSQSFGSFMALRSFPRLLHDGWGPVNEPGVPGQIVVQSPIASPTASCNGRCYTTDWGYLDSSGELHIMSETAAPAARSLSA